MDKVRTILDNAKLIINEDIYRKIIIDCGEWSNTPTLPEQAKYISCLMESITHYCSNDDIVKIMNTCAYNCISKSTIEKAKKLYSESSDFSEFLNDLNINQIGGGKLYLDGNRIIGVYDRCYCDLAKATNNLTSSYCNCSAGWFKILFSTVLNKEVNVIKKRTILDGASECTFEIFALDE